MLLSSKCDCPVTAPLPYNHNFWASPAWPAILLNMAAPKILIGPCSGVCCVASCLDWAKLWLLLHRHNFFKVSNSFHYIRVIHGMNCRLFKFWSDCCFDLFVLSCVSGHGKVASFSFLLLQIWAFDVLCMWDQLPYIETSVNFCHSHFH